MELNEFLEPSEVELDVQRAVVESLAADKAEQDEKITALNLENERLKSEIAQLKDEIRAKVAELKAAGELLAKNSETTGSNQIALLDREIELKEHFPGESRDQVLEVIREARDAAEKNGRSRRAQILESVLVANDSVGNLAQRRQALQKVFAENGNIINGPVIEELNKLGISYKNGEEYLLPAEILQKNY